MQAKTVFFVLILAIVCVGFGLASTLYVLGSRSNNLRHALVSDIRQVVAKELKALADQLGTQGDVQGGRSDLSPTASLQNGSAVANVGAGHPYGPHGHELLAALREGGYTLFFRPPRETISSRIPS